MIRVIPNLFASYSFSFTIKTADNLRYFRKTTHAHRLNSKSEEFILNFITNSKPLQPDSKTLSPKRGRPKKKIIDNKIYAPFNLSLKKTTIKKIQEYKQIINMPNLDSALEKYLKIQIPVRK